jgi:DNA repair exonuclease SbcCD nuclease subunit
MLISHISDLHLGYSQFSLEEREEDVYHTFHEAIDTSIKERVKLVILAGDLFHNPRPCGKAIITLGNILKKLKEKQILTVFVLGEHDISRLRDVPFVHIYSNLGLAKKLRYDAPLIIENCALFGVDKERRSSVDSLIEKMHHAERLAKQHGGKRVLVLHQGLADFNKFAGELNSTDLPKEFNYYAMGHYHEHYEKRFDFLGGPLAYPGSIDLTPSEGIKEVDKGFIVTDVSGEEPSIHWVRLENRRPQFSTRINYKDIAYEVSQIVNKATGYRKKPIAKIEVAGSNIDSKVIAEHLKKLSDCCLHYVWQPLEDHLTTTVYQSRPADIDSELYRLSADALGSDELAKFVIDEVLPSAADKDAKSVLDILWQAYKLNKFRGYRSK